jgi:hypothetical protein
MNSFSLMSSIKMQVKRNLLRSHCAVGSGVIKRSAQEHHAQLLAHPQRATMKLSQEPIARLPETSLVRYPAALALLRRWKKESGDYDDHAVALLESAKSSTPITLRPVDDNENPGS